MTTGGHGSSRGSGIGQTVGVTTSKRLFAASVLAISVLIPASAGAQTSAPVGFGSVSPGVAPAGTEVSYTVAGSADADPVCRGSSAFATELLGADGTRLAIGADTVAVPQTATAGPGFLRLICYIPDATGRRVIHGFCAAIELAAAGTAPGAPLAAGAEPIVDPCPPSGRVVASQAVIGASTALGLSFNQIIKPLGG